MQTNKNVYSVQQINSYIKRLFEEDFILKNVYVKGEISNCKYHYSGHIYFSLKDASGTIAGVMFASNASSLKFRLEDGMQVVVYGNVSVYERDGRYQLYARRIENEGLGELYKKYEELRIRLEESGMFDPCYKKAIPKYSMKIGVVTAQTGAVIRDIYNVASRRNPYCQIYLYPAQVQGIGASQTICEGIRVLDEMNLDAIIVGRGGGSIEDLWAFNEENVARAIFDARTPIISAVGHETDTTIADWAADLRAPTPSAAAELAVFDYQRFADDLNDYIYRMQYALSNKVRHYVAKAENYKLRLDKLSPQNQIIQKQQYLADLTSGMEEVMKNRLSCSREQLITLTERLEGLSPLKRLSEGYSFVTDMNGHAVRSVVQVKAGDKLQINVSDGIINAEADEVKSINRCRDF